MKNTLKMSGIIAFTAVIGLCLFTVVGCNNNPTGPSGPPSSVGDYSNLEPQMADNPNRAVTTAGGVTEIGIPDSLRSSLSVESRAATDATFSVHPDDITIAEIVSQTGTTCRVRGITLGSARINISVGSLSAVVVVYVMPSESFYRLPMSQVKYLSETSSYWDIGSNRPDSLPSDYSNYRTEPMHQLAWNWRNPSQSFATGTSGTNCGIDILAYFVNPRSINRRGWVRTTYGFGGWHYDLNGVTNTMTDGVQISGNVKLELKPEFVYDNGVPYLQITHVLTNLGNTRLTEQKFGASADVMIFGNDHAPLTHLAYGALMTDADSSSGRPTIKYRLVCQGVQGIDTVSTLWLGTYGSERNYVYVDKRDNITGRDSALNFSYQNITLEPGQSKNFVIRYTQVQ